MRGRARTLQVLGNLRRQDRDDAGRSLESARGDLERAMVALDEARRSQLSVVTIDSVRTSRAGELQTQEACQRALDARRQRQSTKLRDLALLVEQARERVSVAEAELRERLGAERAVTERRDRLEQAEARARAQRQDDEDDDLVRRPSC